MTIVDARVVCVTGGVDTHLDFHVAAALDQIGGELGIESFETTTVGYQQLLDWLSGFGPVTRVGVEGTGSYGTGLARFLAEHGIEVVEVDRPNRQLRHRQGKSDPTDAVAAARVALSGQATGTPKLRNGPMEQMRVLLIARRSGREQRVQTLNQIRQLVTATAPDLLDIMGLAAEGAAVLLAAAGDNPQRVRTEAAWAHMCGVAPIPASSGKTVRHRLNRGGNRQANSVLYRIVITRMSADPRTQTYIQQRRDQGRSTKEIIRALKRYVAREIYKHLPRPDLT